MTPKLDTEAPTGAPACLPTCPSKQMCENAPYGAAVSFLAGLRRCWLQATVLHVAFRGNPVG